MPSLESVKAFRKKMFDESMSLIDKKGHDYNRKQQLTGDTLFNLRVASIMGIVETPEQGIMVRLVDKMMRLASLMAPGAEAQVKDESVRETVRDAHNYLDYMLQLWEEGKAQKVTQQIILKEEISAARVPDLDYTAYVPVQKMGEK